MVVMKRLLFHFSISLLTFCVGFAAVWSTKLRETVQSLPPSEPVSPVLLSYPAETPADLRKPRFIATGRGCGFGYVQQYETADGQRLAEGMSGFERDKKARASFKKRISQAVRVIERGTRYRSHPSQTGERVVLVNPPDENGVESVSILWYGGGQFTAYIEAPSLDLALEFEQYLESINYVG